MLSYFLGISIHAPLTGSDFVRSASFAHFTTFQSTLPSQGATHVVGSEGGKNVDFNPRSPHRERPILTQATETTRQFQSTLPSQGATSMTLQMRKKSLSFQSTLPSQGATCFKSNFTHIKVFQSTLPSQGATVPVPLTVVLYLISIHAPLTGSDSKYTHKIPL